MYHYITSIACTVFLVICSITDVKSRKIKNAVTFPAIITGLVLTALNSLTDLAVACVAIILLFVIGFFRKKSLGDIKLLMGTVALKGVTATLFSLFAGCFFFLLIFICIRTIGIFDNKKKVPMSPVILMGYIAFEVVAYIVK